MSPETNFTDVQKYLQTKFEEKLVSLPYEFEFQTANGNPWQIGLSGRMPEQPSAFDTQTSLFDIPIARYDLTKFTITGPNKQSLDLINLTPPGWTWKQIRPLEKINQDQETLGKFGKLIDIDPTRQQIVIGNLPFGCLSEEQIVRRCTRFLLEAKYSVENGHYPKSVEGQVEMLKRVNQRHREIIHALTDTNLATEIFQKPF